jgi:hypothetical protein
MGNEHLSQQTLAPMNFCSEGNQLFLLNVSSTLVQANFFDTKW